MDFTTLSFLPFCPICCLELSSVCIDSCNYPIRKSWSCSNEVFFRSYWGLSADILEIVVGNLAIDGGYFDLIADNFDKATEILKINV